jgi:hypothetical protein
VLATLLQIQGQFSTVADISKAYVKISDNWIRPAINRMEQLALTTDEDWVQQRNRFNQWCEQAVDDIDGVFKTTQENMEPNMAKRIGMLQRLAIEAAEDT